jgi:hypothetical protein
MFATPFTSFHTILSLLAILAGAFVIRSLINNERPGFWTLAFLATMIATDVTGFMFPFDKVLPSHMFGVLSLVLIVVALLAHYVFGFAGAWRGIYAWTIGFAVYLNFFVLVTQLFLKVAPGSLRLATPDNPTVPFLIAQGILLVVFVWLIRRGAKNFRPASVR